MKINSNDVDPGFWVIMSQTDDAQTFFLIQYPEDESEEDFQIMLSTASWKSQGSPSRLYVKLTAELDEDGKPL